ncbi:MAG: NUDIX domain-containing protein [Hyphomicrobiaceae bacterium]|nr:MAG: NUDIX domain-containing protein [Hyphomicrobiaceae bacterium]
MPDQKPKVRPRPAATVVILRDGREGIEAFMVVRHHAIDFASGALVFPGGKVDAEDADPVWTDLASSAGAGPDRSFVVAAARETFEEAGLVLARRRGAQGLLGADEAHQLVQRYRAPLVKGEITYRDLIRNENLQVATELMVPFAHWITPDVVPKRFDTHFFLVAAPVDQLGAHDGGESVEGLWITPRQALREADAGTRTLVFATLMNLRKLARYSSVAEAVLATRSSPVVTVMPRVQKTADGRLMHIPEAAGYGVSQVLMPADSAPMKS